MSTTDSNIGRIIGKYKIIEHLGRGGMAEVYKAYHENLGRHVAIKLMHPFLAADEDFLNRFRREAKAMGALSHPHIVNVYDFDVEGNTYYIVMEYVSGGTLKALQESQIASGEQMELGRVVQIILELADALAYAHSRDMIHRDIKPGNVMLNERGSAVLMDFGIAKMKGGPTYTATGAMIGTPAYMSPEQGLGQPGDARSDLYSLGVMFFQLATGQLPYDADTPLAVVMKHVNAEPVKPSLLNPSLPPEIEKVILKTLAKNPDDRFPTVHAFARELRHVVKEADLGLQGAVPAQLLRDKPTPLPVREESTVVAQEETTAPGRGYEATQMAAGAATVNTPVHDKTELTPVPPPTVGKRAIPRWAIIIGVGVLLALLAGGAYAGGVFGGSVEPTATSAQVAVAPTATAAATASDTLTPSPTPDLDATADARVAAALTRAAPTITPTSAVTNTPTITPTPSPTPNATATILAGCVPGVSLENAFAGSSRQNIFAIVGIPFTMNWELKNSGTCPWPEVVHVAYLAGEELGQTEPVRVETNGPLAVDGTVRVSTRLTAPKEPNRTYESTWQLVDSTGTAFGEPFSFEIRTFVPATATPTRPAAPPTSAAPTTGATEQLGLNYEVTNCEYPGGGTEWRCELKLIPYGGSKTTYTIFVFDSEPPARYLGAGNTFHFITARRCAPYIHEVKVQDEGTGEQFSRNVFFDPNSGNYFGGQPCTLP